MKARIEPTYKVICNHPHGADGKNSNKIYLRRVDLEKCEKCKYFKGLDLKKLEVDCGLKKAL